jgi:hypothetical protein
VVVLSSAVLAGEAGPLYTSEEWNEKAISNEKMNEYVE